MDDRPGGSRRSDWSDVGCSHVGECPLFPLLNASLSGWRTSYCDSDSRWRDCARHQLASRGQLVPISLLPNGKDVGHFRWAANRAAGSGPEHPPVGPHPSEATGASFEAAPQRQHRFPEPSPITQNPRPSDNPAARPPQAAQRQRAPKRRWWKRIADWMKDSL